MQAKTTRLVILVLLVFTFLFASHAVAVEPIETNTHGTGHVMITTVGDCTLGTDITFGYEATLPAVLDSNSGDPAYIFRNIYPITSSDDLTIANLEGTFTTCNARYPKTFAFKGPPEYAKILTAGSVEAVNVSNNHIYDYYEQGFQDTVKALEGHGVQWFGEGTAKVFTTKGIKIGLLGYAFSVDQRQLAADIAALKSVTDIVIVSFHWGKERSYSPDYEQTQLARHSIDSGADMVFGHHPHVLQGIEIYNKRLIAYSLGNFAFGGNINPPDKRTMLLQAKFSIAKKGITTIEAKVIPARVSSVTWINDYQPTLLEGHDRQGFLGWFQTLCPNVRLKDGVAKVL